jgi:hypothetical protein
MQPLPPYLATDFPIFQTLGRAWGSTPLVARVAQRGIHQRFGQLIVLREPGLEIPFLLLNRAANADGDSDLVESYLSALRATLWDKAALGLEDEDFVDVARDYFAAAVAEVRSGKGWRKAGSIPFCRVMEHGLINHDDATGAHSFIAFQNVLGAIDPNDGQRVRNARCAAKAAGLPPPEFRSVIAAMAATLSCGVIDPLGSLQRSKLDRSKPKEGGVESRNTVIAMAGTGGVARPSARR